MKLVKSIVISTFLFIIPFNSHAAIRSFPPQHHYSSKDATITQAIKSKFKADPLIHSFNIAVATNQGAVGLMGQVSSKTEYEQAIRLAESTPGVNDVNTNGFSVKGSKTPLDDLAINAKIRGKIIQAHLFSEKEIAYRNIKIETHDHVVYLSGKVNSAAIRTNLEKIASSTKGVQLVKNALQVG